MDFRLSNVSITWFIWEVSLSAISFILWLFRSSGKSSDSQSQEKSGVFSGTWYTLAALETQGNRLGQCFDLRNEVLPDALHSGIFVARTRFPDASLSETSPQGRSAREGRSMQA